MPGASGRRRRQGASPATKGRAALLGSPPFCAAGSMWHPEGTRMRPPLGPPAGHLGQPHTAAGGRRGHGRKAADQQLGRRRRFGAGCARLHICALAWPGGTMGLGSIARRCTGLGSVRRWPAMQRPLGTQLHRIGRGSNLATRAGRQQPTTGRQAGMRWHGHLDSAARA